MCRKVSMDQGKKRKKKGKTKSVDGGAIHRDIHGGILWADVCDE